MGIVLTIGLAVALHEAGHVIAALCLGIAVRRLGLSWKGVYIVRAHGTPQANMLTTLAGPAANVLIAIVFASYPEFARINLMFGLINLLPIPGSDGQRALAQVRRGSGRTTA